MSNIPTQEMLEYGGFEAALDYHLRHRHYPPVPRLMDGVIRRAIEHGRDGEWDMELPLPKGVEWRGKMSAPVWTFIDNFHLGPFVEEERDV